MELEKYIRTAKEAINKGYFGIQDALIKYDESLERLKSRRWNSKETAYQQEYQKIVATFNEETAAAISTCKAEVQKQKEAYMKEVDAYYMADGSKIDLNDMNLIKFGVNLKLDEIISMTKKHLDNPTMLRLIHKYVLEVNSHLPEDRRMKLPDKYNIMFMKVEKNGKVEKSCFETFEHLATMGMNHPDKSFTMHQAYLDDYEEDAVLKLLKAKPFIDEETQQRINQIEQKRIDDHNSKR